MKKEELLLLSKEELADKCISANTAWEYQIKAHNELKEKYEALKKGLESLAFLAR